jgi:hypothetical protein
MIEGWMIASIMNVIMVIAYAWIAFVMFKGIQQGGQWLTNPLAVAVFVIFAVCTVGHGAHIIHAIEPMLGIDDPVGAATRQAMSDPTLWGWEIVTACVAVWYLSMRGRLHIVHLGSALCEDLVARQRQAQEIQLTVTAGVRRAKEAFEAGDRETAAKELDAALASSKSIITKLLGKRGSLTALGPGDLRRRVAAG